MFSETTVLRVESEQEPCSQGPPSRDVVLKGINMGTRCLENSTCLKIKYIVEHQGPKGPKEWVGRVNGGILRPKKTRWTWQNFQWRIQPK